MKNFSITTDADGVALITFDVPNKAMNVVSFEVQQEFADVVETLRTTEAIRGAVLMSGKPSGFCAGADLPEIMDRFDGWRAARTQAELRQGLSESGSWSRHLRALETCGKPVAAVIAGMALGGGLEMALACHYRVAADNPALRLAFPEVGVGLLPGAGGTQRLLRLLGIQASLPHLLDGAPITPAQALAGNVVHALLPAEQLLEAARSWVLDHPQAVAPWDEKDFKLPGGNPHTPNGYRFFGPAVAARQAQAGGHYPAVANILKAVYEGSQVPIDAGLRIESRYFFNTVRAPQAKAMARTNFVSRQVLAKRAQREDLQGYLGALALAVETEKQAMLDEGFSASLVANLAGKTSHRAEVTAAPAAVHPLVEDVDFAELEQLQQRLLYAQAICAFRCLDNGTVADPLEADVGAVAAGFPVWTGGPLSYIEQEGVPRFIEQAEYFASRFGERFQVPVGLRHAATAGLGFYA